MSVMKRLSVVLSIASLLAIAILLNFDQPGSIEPQPLLPVLNTLFLGILPFTAVFFAARTYLRANLPGTLLMSCGLLIFGLGSILSGWLSYLPDGGNTSVTVHNACASIGASLQLASVMWTEKRDRPLSSSKIRLSISIIGIAVFTGLLSAGAVFNIIPPFVRDGTPTVLQEIVLWSAIVFFFTSSIVYLKQYLKQKTDSLFWYAAALALITIGLFALNVQPSQGSAICWIGRVDQYAGGLFALLSILAMRKEARERSSDIPSIMADFFTYAESGYRSLVETSNDAILSVDEDFHIFFSNSSAEKLFGYTKEETRKISFLDLLVHEHTQKLLKNDAIAFKNWEPGTFVGRMMEIKLKGKGGRQFPAELSLSIRRLPSGLASTYIIRDITRRNRNAERIQRQNTILNAITQIYEKAVTSATMEELGSACLDIIQTVTESKMGFIGETGKDGLFHDIAFSESGWDACRMTDKNGHRKNPGNFNIKGLYGSVLKSGRSVLSNEPSAHPESTGAPEGHPMLTAFLGVPFIRDGRVAGMIAAANREGGYRNEDLEVLEALAPTICEVIQRKRAEEESRKNEILLRTVIEGTNDPIFLKDRSGIMIMANTATAEAIGLPVAELLGKNDLAYYSDARDALPIMENDRRIMQSNKAEEIEEIISTKEGRKTFLSSKTPWHDAEGNVIGVVGVARNITARKNLELQLQMLYGIAGRLLASENPQSIINELCTDVMHFLDCQSFFNYLVGEDNILRLNAYKGIPPHLLPEVEQLKMGEALCGSVAQSKQRLAVGGIQQLNDPVTEFLRGLGIRAYACHPLMNHDKAAGTLAFCTQSRDRFTDEELALMKAVADHVAVALGRAEAEARIMEMNRELVKKSQLVTDFFTNVSHEFKTPLSIILIELELMEYHIQEADCLYAQDVRRISDVMRQNSFRLSRLIQNLLDVTKIDAGFMNVNLRSADMIQVLGDLVASVSDFAKNAGINMQFLSELEQRVIPMDVEKTERIMLNLLSNAIKHTAPGGRITVRVEDAGGSVIISVKDTGEGIPQDKMEIIFDRFRQVNTSLTRNTEGSGIGLSLTKALVELLKGRIWFESEGGKGSEFFIELPVLPLEGQMQMPEIEGMSMVKKVEMELSDIRKLETV